MSDATGALFGSPQRDLRPIPLGNIKARAERADDLALVIAEQGIAPFNQPFLPGLREHWILEECEISADQTVEPCVECVPYARGNAGVDPTAAMQSGAQIARVAAYGTVTLSRGSSEQGPSSGIAQLAATAPWARTLSPSRLCRRRHGGAARYRRHRSTS